MPAPGGPRGYDPRVSFLIALLLLSPLAHADGVRVLAPGQARLSDDAVGTFKGEVVSAVTGRALAGVPLVLLRPAPTEARSWPEPWAPEAWREDERLLRVKTGPDGTWRFDGLPSGPYRVVVDNRWLPKRSIDRYVDPGAVVSGRMELTVGTRVSGRVVNEEGDPLASFPVYVAGLDLGDGRNSSRGRPASEPGHTGPDGTFTLRWVPQGTAWLQAGRIEYGFSPLQPLVLEPGTAEVGDVQLVVTHEAERLAEAESGGGIGVRLDFTPRGPVVSSLVPSLPAAEAGMLEGDVIVTIDGRSTRFMTSIEFIQRCRGQVGSTVELTLVRDGAPRDVTLTRESIPRRRRK